MTMRKAEADRMWEKIQEAQTKADDELAALVGQQQEESRNLLADRFRLTPDGRAAAAAKRKAKNKQRRYKKRWAQQRRLRMKHTLVHTGKWWPFLTERWKSDGVGVELTEGEWEELVQPFIKKGDSIWINRYDTSKPLAWDNMYVESEKPTVNGNMRLVVIYDGAEEKLKAMGYCL